MKIAIIIGTRPEIIKMAPVIDEIEKRGIDYILIHTGQHYDHEMSQQFFVDLELKKPDFNIGVGSGSHGKQTALMMEKIEDVLVAEKPDIVLVQGDTNAVLAGALAASKLHIAVGHVEAGLRSYDKTMPEEINRQVADVTSNLYFVPTEESALNLVFEGLNPHEIFVTGNTVVDACIRNLKIAQKSSTILSDLDLSGDILTLTMHRAENVDDPERLQEVMDALLELEDITVVFPVHPRTVKTLKKFGIYEKLENAPHVLMTKPIGYLDFLVLLSNSRFIMTDSGGLQEEAITLNVPCLTLRYNTERPETVTAGGNILVGSSREKILENLKEIAGNESVYKKMSEANNPYGDGKASEKILDAVLNASSSGKLQITAPEYIMSHAGRELLQIREEITVSEFENGNSGSTINIVFNGNEAQFPHPDLDLKDKMVLVNMFDIK
ncbi:non-hydrolyzing UDP-N-acetylglucosamine 2-epimerase [Methanobacterium aggregans]|uniref:non-hydrolyzing UDP-N-acetylglucosamine 2-epimerase n=1 Tax=Methanobacterium aggregans TaxID=1615586 RepID=UPI001AEAD6D6|nr:UDP-N-acetylglucosamine 2-epimerase (non-hydrolyzing) [Methanobacterium aggregans]MBP2046860.1 UDP-N-acetylglucosamine 2-epimerase (non-hydrolyzing) [Methanobacterium aggregans]